ncbi:protein of unknown function [Candidatus Hydrogenisulfobacillus filiaventi]|uniref:Uncharacterized protein n=1 Tax=Candidatus Hydrogenisulfobacillus filiaventi TaxID=2707344 RepID=A0A6F8ZI36_9FIRM|nr:protein of unknown function [Candidatus Hydrogenisulfobacillus filiaventi]
MALWAWGVWHPKPPLYYQEPAHLYLLPGGAGAARTLAMLVILRSVTQLAAGLSGGLLMGLYLFLLEPAVVRWLVTALLVWVVLDRIRDLSDLLRGGVCRSRRPGRG